MSTLPNHPETPTTHYYQEPSLNYAKNNNNSTINDTRPPNPHCHPHESEHAPHTHARFTHDIDHHHLHRRRADPHLAGRTPAPTRTINVTPAPLHNPHHTQATPTRSPLPPVRNNPTLNNLAHLPTVRLITDTRRTQNTVPTPDHKANTEATPHPTAPLQAPRPSTPPKRGGGSTNGIETAIRTDGPEGGAHHES